MKKPIFEPSDFEIDRYKDIRFVMGPIEASNLANAKINKLIESWPVVYGSERSRDWTINKWGADTHKARLAFIEELPKEPCKHEPEQVVRCTGTMIVSLPYHICKHCGIELVAEWKPKSEDGL